MGKQRTVCGPYSGGMSKDKVVEMDRERTRPKTVADGKSLADKLDPTFPELRPPRYPYDGLSGPIIQWNCQAQRLVGRTMTNTGMAGKRRLSTSR